MSFVIMSIRDNENAKVRKTMVICLSTELPFLVCSLGYCLLDYLKMKFQRFYINNVVRYKR